MTARQCTWVQQMCNRKETTWSDLDRVQRIAVKWGTRSWSEASLTSLQGGASVGAPWLQEEDMGRRSPLSLCICLSIYLSTNNKRWAPFGICEIYFYQEVFHSFIEVVNHLWLCFRLYLYYSYITICLFTKFSSSTSNILIICKGWNDKIVTLEKTTWFYFCKLWQQDHCQHPQNANLDDSTLEGDENKVSSYGYGLWCGFKWGPHHATSHLWSRLESQHQSVPGCAEECGGPLVQSGGRWQTLVMAAGLGAGSQVQRDPGLASEGVLRLCTLLSLAPDLNPLDYFV